MMRSSMSALAMLAVSSAAGLADDAAPLSEIVAPVDWTGVYVGAHAGYGWGHVSRGGAGVGQFGADDGDSDGVVGGAQLGANWQWKGLVLGAEADLSGVDLSSDSATPGGVTILHTDVDYFGTARARVGVAFDRVLLYGTGGLAYAGFDQRFQVLGVQGRDSGTQFGWTAGSGLEVAFDAHWSVKAEYLHADLGTKRYAFRNAGGGLRTRINVSYEQQLARVGLNYKF